MMLKYISFLACFLLLFSCNQKPAIDSKAREIIEKSVEAHGGNHYKKFDISFDFRKFRFHIKLDEAKYIYERTSKDSLNNEIHDRLTNESFIREINGKRQELSAKDEGKYREGTNSVAYFMLLPYKLLDPAVNLAYIGSASIGGQNYDKIKVSFEQEGGGKDHDDIFCYWINQQTHTLDYLAYDNGGPRFRKATNRQTIAGIVFQDYENFEIADKSLKTNDYDKVFVEGKAKLLSKIEQTNYVENK